MKYVRSAGCVRKRITKIRFSFAFLVTACVAASHAAFCATAVAPALLKVRLESHLTSYSSKSGSPFRAVVLADYGHDGRVFIPEGSVIYGVVRHATSVGLGFRHERARLALDFREYQTPDGQRLPLSAKLVSIDNAREKVLSDGQIRGLLAAQ